MKTKLLIPLILAANLSVFDVAFSDDVAGVQEGAKLDRQISVQLDYLLYLPKDYDKKESWPLLLFLHGSGERGDDLELVKIHGPPKLIGSGKQFPFMDVSPQCPKDQRWHAITLTALLDEVIEKYKVDEDRIYVSGFLVRYSGNRMGTRINLGKVIVKRFQQPFINSTDSDD